MFSRVLDCESFESTLLSFSDIVGLPADSLRDKLLPIRLDEYLQNFAQQSGDPGLDLWNLIFDKPPAEVEFEGIYWFHLTRVLDVSSFAVHGILPLNEQIEYIWEILFALTDPPLDESGKAKLRSHMEEKGSCDGSRLYSLKLSQPLHQIHQGPFAMLVKESAFHASSMLNHDYLRTPEIIEDICGCYKGCFLLGDLLSRFQTYSKPCIVKFIWDSSQREDVLPASLLYLYEVLHDEEFSLYTNTCFDGEGNAVPASAIVRISSVDLESRLEEVEWPPSRHPKM